MSLSFVLSCCIPIPIAEFEFTLIKLSRIGKSFVFSCFLSFFLVFVASFC
jgi:hypothetical protein